MIADDEFQSMAGAMSQQMPIGPGPTAPPSSSAEDEIAQTLRAALQSLYEVYLARMAGAPDLPSNDQAARYLLQQIHSPFGRESTGKCLDEVQACQIQPSVLITLVHTLLESRHLKIALADADKGVDGAVRIWADAKKILQKRPLKGTPEYRLYGTAHKRHSAALYALGLIGEAHGEGRQDDWHQEAAAHYYLLRAGGGCWRDGGCVEVKPIGHDAAISIVMQEFDIQDLQNLERAWRRKGIEVSYDAEVFPIKSRR